MAEISNTFSDYKMSTVPTFVAVAEANKPCLIHRSPQWKCGIGIGDEAGEKVAKILTASPFPTGEMRRGDSRIFDLGTHAVGYLKLTFRPVGGIPDAPLFFRIKCGERLFEIAADSRDYHGMLSSSWIQEEYVHADVLPCTVSLPRRYAFRYLELTVLDTSPNFAVECESIEVDAVSAVNPAERLPLSPTVPARFAQIYGVSALTLAECMQDVLEDGPKRDRRLWLGDLRLEALADYATFRSFGLVKRCLYLFAGLRLNDEGLIGACMFTEPDLHVSSTYLYDYSLIFIPSLWEYYENSGDRETLAALWDSAYRQVEIALRRLDKNGVVRDDPSWWCFLDWHPELNKQAGAQGVLIYAMRYALKIAEELGDGGRAEKLRAAIARAADGAMKVLYDEKSGYFLSGEERQISLAAETWMLLADILPADKRESLIDRLIADPPKIGAVTPYMYHYYMEMLDKFGRREEVEKILSAYFGGMVDDGADCFFESYDPENKHFSSYGDEVINSFCHAWSCSPSHFIRKYYGKA